jgi:purine-nucleoside phosphorylase
LKELIENAKKFILKKLEENQFPAKVDVLCVLGSGLGPYAEKFPNSFRLKYSEIPGFETPSVSGHKGEILFTILNEKVIAFQLGRLHRYEGLSFDQVNLPLRTICSIGAKNVLLTNASGAINKDFHPGDLIIIKDHINLSGQNPLIGRNHDFLGPRFPDMTEVYSKAKRKLLSSIASELKIELKTGIYLHVSGPTYETPAEIRFFRLIGGDLVGMSTVPEAIAARHMGVEVSALACITNYAAGILDEPLSHEDVTTEALKAMEKFTLILDGFLKEITIN